MQTWSGPGRAIVALRTWIELSSANSMISILPYTSQHKKDAPPKASRANQISHQRLPLFYFNTRALNLQFFYLLLWYLIPV